MAHPSPLDPTTSLVKNTSEALSLVAQGLSWRRGDNLVGIAQEFPSNRLPWEALAAQGVETRWLDLYASQDPEADLVALCDAHTRLMSVSSVQYARGLRLNLERLGAFCRPRGTAVPGRHPAIGRPALRPGPGPGGFRGGGWP